ncbi:DUF488 domain-containing protein [Desulfotomaculum copahuensis]|uniref:MarR family transcriptional regulator n=1 Tax=Desulfotomaculum copahuensis TaxID=1838280 RepID=A0A1B7LKR0_9FIRM|nr:DUF488 domain-containing protein [Desulfotomaculum copahuensis]OAT87149.1 hypothetical protein A6M21_02100 [Desulfotomaculum copahuensis]
MIKLKRIYEPPGEADGRRILVERLWPRGLSKERAAVGLWLKDVAPSPGLRRWFGHEPDRWPEFKARYRAELAAKEELVAELAQLAGEGTVTFLFAARDEKRNSAVVLKEYIEERLAAGGR